MVNLFEAHRVCFEYVANIFAKSNAENGKSFVKSWQLREFDYKPEYFEEIFKVLKTHFLSMSY